MNKIKKIFLCLCAFILLTACQRSSVIYQKKSIELITPANYVVLLSPDENQYIIYGNEKLIDVKYPPCSTFKIVSTLIGLDEKIILPDNNQMEYDGTIYEIPACNADITAKQAFQASCVWYYKKLIAHMKKTDMQAYLQKLQYGNQDISVWNRNGHNVFWIESSLLISPTEQLTVLRDIFGKQKVFSSENVEILKDYMFYNELNGIKIYGKTGTGRNHYTGKLEAWYVGFFVLPNKKITYFSAHGDDPKRDVLSPEVRELVIQLIKSNQLSQ